MKISSSVTIFLILLQNAFASNGLESINLPNSCPQIIKRQKWGARPPLKSEDLAVPIDHVIVHHTVTQNCLTESECSDMVKKIQNYHMEKLEFDDIGYNYLVGGDGSVYEGTGWYQKGTHTAEYNTKSLGLAFIGTFKDVLPNTSQLAAAKTFLDCLVEFGALRKNYKLFGARQVRNTDSPGLKLYHEIQKWTHFSPSPDTDHFVVEKAQ